MRKIGIFLFVLLLPLSAGAHPHVYIDMALGIDISPEGLERLHHTWWIKWGFASVLIEHYDADGDGRFDSREAELLKREAFDNLKNHLYFVQIEKNQEYYGNQEISDFSTRIDGDRVVLQFSQECGIPVGSEDVVLDIAVVDETGYVSFALWGIDDPPCEGIDYDVYIHRDQNFYSHGNTFGLSRIQLTLNRTESRPEASVSENKPPAMGAFLPLEKLPPLPDSSAVNPFFSPGCGPGEPEAVNPFLAP